MSKPIPRSRPKKTKHRLRLVVLLLIVVVLVYVGLAETRPIPTVVASTYAYEPNLSQKLALTWPLSGEAALGVDGYGVIATSPNQTIEPTASIAKLMTALAVLKQKPLGLGQMGPTITLTAQDVAIYQAYVAEGGSVVNVVAGENISEYQALQAMLLPSANNMADSLAIWAFGSIANYVTYADQMAKDMGLADSHFADSSGFSPETTSTPSDLIVLGEQVLQNPVLAQITAQASVTVPVAGLVHNVNWLLGEDNVIGIKTGNTTQAGGTYLFAANYKLADEQSITLIGAIMKAQTLNQALDEAVPLLAAAKKQIELKSLLPAGTVVGEYKTAWAGNIPIRTDASINMPYLAGMQPSFQLSLDKTRSPILAGEVEGVVNVKMGDTSANTTISSSRTVTKPGWLWIITHPLKTV